MSEQCVGEVVNSACKTPPVATGTVNVPAAHGLREDIEDVFSRWRTPHLIPGVVRQRSGA